MYGAGSGRLRHEFRRPRRDRRQQQHRAWYQAPLIPNGSFDSSSRSRNWPREVRVNGMRRHSPIRCKTLFIPPKPRPLKMNLKPGGAPQKRVVTPKKPGSPIQPVMKEHVWRPQQPRVYSRPAILAPKADAQARKPQVQGGPGKDGSINRLFSNSCSPPQDTLPAIVKILTSGLDDRTWGRYPFGL